jgi:uncharacterized protein
VLSRFSLGFVSRIGLVLMAPVSIFTVKAAHALPRRELEIAFGAFLRLVSIRGYRAFVPRRGPLRIKRSS